MAGWFISALGIFITGVGTFMRVAPDLPRWHRRRWYKIFPMTRDLFEKRRRVKSGSKSLQHTVRDRRVTRELIDYVDAKSLEEPPDTVPKSIKSVAAHIEAEYPDGDVERFVEGQISNRTLVELLTLTIERECRNYGLLTALIGAGLAIIGTVV